jgi:hypothetical protein
MRPHILFLVSLFLFVSCGEKSKGNGQGDAANPNEEVQNETISSDGSNINGVYATTLLAMNKNIHIWKVGTAAVQRVGDTFTAFVKIKYGQRNTTFKQSIYTGSRCPTMKDDLNEDAYVDINEALVAIGQIVIPLDGNLDSQTDGSAVYPAGDAEYGAFLYQSTASFARMFADLKSPDLDPSDNIIKLKADEGLSLPGRIVLLQGINESLYVPDTASTNNEGSVHKTMPIACGVLKKVGTLPTELTGAM